MVIAPSPYESRRFGLRVGRGSPQRGQKIEPTQMIEAAERAIRADAFDLVILRFARSNMQLDVPIEALSTHSATSLVLIDAGEIITYESVLHTPCKKDRSESQDEPRQDAPVVSLNRITSWGATEHALVCEIFGGYLNHIASNPRLDATLVAEGYAEWSSLHVDGPLNGSCHRLIDRSGSTVAFAAVRTEDDTLIIDLAGVIPKHRRQGNYQLLLAELEALGRNLDLRNIRIATQTTNSAAIHAWQRRGWLEAKREQMLHVMR